MITDVELYYYRWDELIEKELRVAVEIAREYYGDENLAEILDCSEATLKKLWMPSRRVPDIPGEPIFEIRLHESIARQPVRQLKLTIGMGIIQAAPKFDSARDLARFLDLSVREIERIMDSAAN
jgi:hypothetical protein